MNSYSTVWIDHKEARIFHVRAHEAQEEIIKATPPGAHHKHPKGPEGPREHPDDAKRFFHEIARSLEGASEILLVGPSTAKLEFFRYVHGHDPTLEGRIVAIETVDHPTDGQLVAYTRQYFNLGNRVT